MKKNGKYNYSNEKRETNFMGKRLITFRTHKKGLTKGAFGKPIQHPTFDPNESNHERYLRLKKERYDNTRD